jgi:hypothetical protein
MIPPTCVLQPVTRDDLVIASLAWGFTIGFGWLTTWTAIKQTRKRYKRNGWRARFTVGTERDHDSSVDLLIIVGSQTLI